MRPPPQAPAPELQATLSMSGNLLRAAVPGVHCQLLARRQPSTAATAPRRSCTAQHPPRVRDPRQLPREPIGPCSFTAPTAERSRGDVVAPVGPSLSRSQFSSPLRQHAGRTRCMGRSAPFTSEAVSRGSCTSFTRPRGLPRGGWAAEASSSVDSGALRFPARSLRTLKRWARAASGRRRLTVLRGVVCVTCDVIWVTLVTHPRGLGRHKSEDI